MSADPEASTLSMSASNSTSTTAGGQDVKLDLSEDEEGQEESSEVCKVVRMVTCMPLTKGKII